MIGKSAGELREMGINIPENIPDVATVKDITNFKSEGRVDPNDPHRLIIDLSFTPVFDWISITIKMDV
jgi:hypothetical protein